MFRKTKVSFRASQKLEYAKLIKDIKKAEPQY